jgi:hypothetical protein
MGKLSPDLCSGSGACVKPYVAVAVALASALVNGDWARAHALLVPELRTRLAPEALREKFYGMFRGYSDAEPRSVHFDEQFQMDDWPGKCADDVGWAYVGIEGDGFTEAISVIIVTINGKLLIREVEWGRP